MAGWITEAYRMSVRSASAVMLFSRSMYCYKVHLRCDRAERSRIRVIAKIRVVGPACGGSTR